VIGPEKVHRRAAAHEHLFGGPSSCSDKARGARKQLALWHGDEMGEAVARATGINSESGLTACHDSTQA
jgi:hypothetical protein